MKKFPHISYYLLCLVVFLLSVYSFLNPPTNSITLIGHISIFFASCALFFSTSSAILFTLSFKGNKENNIVNELKEIGKYLLLIILILFMIEYIALPIVNAFIYASALNKIPPKTQFLSSIAYIIIHYAKDFGRGILTTVELSLIGTIVGLILALLLVILITMKYEKKDSEGTSFLKKTANWIASIYVNVFRGTPMMVQAVIFYYLVPILISTHLGIPQANVDQVFTIFVSGLIVVSLNTAAYLTEVLRGAIEALDKGQMEAARSLGLSYNQAMRKVIFPQAIKNALPSIGNEFIINIKDTSVLNVIGVAELFFMTNDAKMKYFRTYEPFIIAACIYLVLTLSLSKLLKIIEKKMKIKSKPLPSSN